MKAHGDADSYNQSLVYELYGLTGDEIKVAESEKSGPLLGSISLL